MEFVDGESVQAALKRAGALPEERALHIMIQTGRALQRADSVGMVHRDIKPDSTLLTKDDVAKLADLGLARESADVSLTLTGMALGTPYYISPEQARGEHDVDIRSDIYSLGTTLYHMVAGEPSFQGSSALAIITKHPTEQLPSPQQKNLNLNDGICHVIEKMMAKDPGRMKPSAQRDSQPDPASSHL